MSVLRRYYDCIAEVRFCEAQGARNGYCTARCISLENAYFCQGAVEVVRQNIVIGAVGRQIGRSVLGLQVTPSLKRTFESGLCQMHFWLQNDRASADAVFAYDFVQTQNALTALNAALDDPIN
ncbi:hypothetical protein SAMN06265373_10642 [Shimia sagamensis]|uniref:Uncharacterized protein n=1 Tax=Shimia sagamensis TaxID=1566352 RepID=A0ABY1PB97_9RHOB|nr:hypothetical protein SAMN06265373_10642 [Shimia sagamensis]